MHFMMDYLFVTYLIILDLPTNNTFCCYLQKGDDDYKCIYSFCTLNIDLDKFSKSLGVQLQCGNELDDVYIF